MNYRYPLAGLLGLASLSLSAQVTPPAEDRRPFTYRTAPQPFLLNRQQVQRQNFLIPGDQNLRFQVQATYPRQSVGQSLKTLLAAGVGSLSLQTLNKPTRTPAFDNRTLLSNRGMPYLGLGISLTPGLLKGVLGRKASAYVRINRYSESGQLLGQYQERLKRNAQPFAFTHTPSQPERVEVVVGNTGKEPASVTLEASQSPNTMATKRKPASDTTSRVFYNVPGQAPAHDPGYESYGDDDGGGGSGNGMLEGGELSGVTVTASYTPGSTAGTVPSSYSGGLVGGSSDAGVSSSHAAGGNGGNTGGNYNPPDKNSVKTKGALFKSTCEAFNTMWNWSFSNNDPSTTVEMAGYELADGSFFLLPWENNTNEESHFETGGEVWDYTGERRYQVRSPRGGGDDLILVKYHPDGSTPDEVPVVGYVHTHPYTDGSHDSYNPTPRTIKQEYGDWQFSSQHNSLPGKIITEDKIINFHFDSNQASDNAKRATDSSTDRSKNCN